MATYAEKLKDPRWQKMRLKVLERDEWECKICGSGDITLHVHHRYYKPNAEPWDYPLESLDTLCADCHEEETLCRKDYEQQLRQALRSYGYTACDVLEIVILICYTSRESVLEFIWSANKRSLWKGRHGSQNEIGPT